MEVSDVDSSGRLCSVRHGRGVVSVLVDYSTA